MTVKSVDASNSSPFEVAIIGAGIVGLATGLEFCTRFPGISLSILDKEETVAAHQTSRNSGVIHSGIYCKPRRLKPRLCVDGTDAIVRFRQEHGVPYEICVKVIVATADEGIPRLEELYRRGSGSGLAGIKTISSQEIRELEPYAAGIRGIHVPSTRIVDYGKSCR